MLIMHEEHMEYEALLKAYNEAYKVNESTEAIPLSNMLRLDELEAYLEKHNYCECGDRV